MMGSWYKVSLIPPNETMVEIAAINFNSEPTVLNLSHAWYDKSAKKWVRKWGEDWEIQYWRYSEQSLFDWLGASGLL